MRTAPWMLVRYTGPGSPVVQTGVSTDDVVHRLPEPWGSTTILELLADWDGSAAALRGIDPAAGEVVEGAELQAPLSFPGKVLCAGANYHGHLEEMSVPVPGPDVAPYFFLKPPRTTVVGPGAPVVLPNRPDARIDWEAELAVVVGRRCKDVSVSDALAVVAGYTIVNDISARDRLKVSPSLAPPFGFNWLAAKGEDTFCPMGPGFVPHWLVDDLQSLAVRTTVSGVVKQDSSTKDMVFSVQELISAASALGTLEPGDVIATGTPAGVGAPRGTFLAAGDEIVVEIEGIGVLRNPVTAAAH